MSKSIHPHKSILLIDGREKNLISRGILFKDILSRSILFISIGILMISCSSFSVWPFNEEPTSSHGITAGGSQKGSNISEASNGSSQGGIYSESSKSLSTSENGFASNRVANSEPFVRFSENNQVPHIEDRKYRRMTRQKMQEESELQAQAGSMWMMEGQSSYLFSQNKTRKEGDLLNVKIESNAQKQIETKVSVIKKLIKKLEEEDLKMKQGQIPTSDSLAQKQNEETKTPDRTVASEKKPEKDDPINIEVVPTRIVEKLSDGSYRIRGQQPFMIGSREYRLLVTGLIRPEDFNDSGVGTSLLLDPQYEVISTRRKQ